MESPSDSADKPGKYALNFEYTRAIELAGGMPFPIPFLLDRQLIPELLDRVDGLLFTGGDDLNPSRFNQTLHPKAIPVHPHREDFEFALLEQAELKRIPLLGICMGCQVLNVHRGGDLHQFLPDLTRHNPIEHRKADRQQPRHHVTVDLSTRLGSVIDQKDLSVNTYHKQAIGKLGKGLQVVAMSPDGIIEAIEDPEYPLFAAVQWHPERLTDEPPHLRLFQMLVKASAG